MKICNILITDYFWELEKDSRVLKTSRSLQRAGHEVKIFCTQREVKKSTVDFLGNEFPVYSMKGDNIEDRFVPFQRRLLWWFYRKKFVRRALEKLGGVLDITRCTTGLAHAMRHLYPLVNVDCDVYHCNDLPGLFLGYLGAKFTGKPLVYDAHELYSDAQVSSRTQRRNRIMERRLIRHTVDNFTVNDSLAKHMSELYHMSKPKILRNFPYYCPLMKTKLLREKLEIAQDTKIVIYQGVLNNERGIGYILEAARMMPEVAFVFMGFGVSEKDIKESGLGNCYLMGIVPPSDVIKWTSSADVGIHPMQNVSLNNYYALGNKIGEYLMAGIPIAVSDFPEMRKIAIEDDVGAVFDPEKPEDMARALRELLEPETYKRKKENVKKAREKYNWDNEEGVLIEVYSKNPVE